jgi:hypothetical protein
MLWFAIYILLFILIVLLLDPIKEGLKTKKAKNPFKKLEKDIKKKVVNPVKKAVVNPIKKLVSKKKPAIKKQVLPVPVAFASYADNVLSPYDGQEFTSIQKDIGEYQKALDGKPSDKIVSKTPLGALYFASTGTKCNAPDGKLVDRYTVVDSRANTDLFNSADADFNKSSKPLIELDYKSTLANKCSPQTITPIDVYGRQLAKQTQYV